MHPLNAVKKIAAGLLFLGVAFVSGNAVAQQASEMDAVKAASNAFYTALTVFDDGEAMGKVWAHTPYVTFVGPRSESIMVGWDAQKKYWTDSNKMFSQRNVTLSNQHIHFNGSLAWEMGHEIADLKLKDGTASKTDQIVTNVYERTDGRWVMVSHHVQPQPQ